MLLNEQDLGALREIRRLGSNDFSMRYLDSLLADAATFRRTVVENDPELAIRLFNIFHDRAIGTYFVEHYQGDKRYLSTVEDITKSLRDSKQKHKANLPNKQ